MNRSGSSGGELGWPEEPWDPEKIDRFPCALSRRAAKNGPCLCSMCGTDRNLSVGADSLSKREVLWEWKVRQFFEHGANITQYVAKKLHFQAFRSCSGQGQSGDLVGSEALKGARRAIERRTCGADIVDQQKMASTA